MESQQKECTSLFINRLTKSFTIFIVFLLIGTIQPFKQQQQKIFTSSLLIATDENSCHLRELELCAVAAGSLLQNPNGIPINEVEMKRQCDYLKESVDCFESYQERCLSSNQNLLISLFAGGLVEIENEFCTNGTEFRKNYMKNAVCLREIQKKYQRSCISDFQAGFEAIHKLNHSTRLSTACCNTNRLQECILPRVEDECGSQALDMLNSLLKRAIGSTISLTCRNYDPFSENCTALLPPIGTKPHNGRNTSAVSRVISSYAHNHL